MITEPIIKKLVNGYRFMWCQGDEVVLSVTIIKIAEQSRGMITGEFSLTHIFEDKPKISGIRINLTSQQARSSLSKRLTEAEIFSDLDKKQRVYPEWSELIEQVFSETIKLFRKGEPVCELWTNEDIPPLEYHIKPILLKGIPTVIFGEKGVAKSTLCLVLYTILILPWHDNPLELEAPSKSTKTIYLDWEVPGVIAQRNIKNIQEGMGLPPYPLYHRRCNFSLNDDLESILEMTVNLKAEVVIVDSLARAAGGELSKDTENANRFFTSLDKLGITSLIVAQTSKDTESKKKTIYGNALYTYYARSIFELCKAQEAGEDDISVALFHRWSNLTKLQRPIGLRLSFNGVGTHIERQPLNIDEFKAKVSGQMIVLEFLKSGAKHVKEITQELGWEESNVRPLLSKMKVRKKIVNLGEGKWGLTY